jgi:hypothetical protein
MTVQGLEPAAPVVMVVGGRIVIVGGKGVTSS